MNKTGDSILTYARTCFSSFDELPFNEIDAAICCQMAYLFLEEDFDNSYSQQGMPVWKLLRAELFEDMCKALPTGDELTELIFAFAASPRYRNAEIKFYRNELNSEISLQFSGVVYSFSDTMHFVGFRGTDKSFVGWKEDVLLTMKKAASCQMMAVNYLNGISEKLGGNFYVGGHSKGGNLASYAAAHCLPEVRDRILHIYDLDGPGFSRQELQTPGMIAIRDKVTKIIASPVGMLMQSETEPIMIQTCVRGIMQHYAFNWILIGNEFTKIKDPEKRALHVIRNINDWAETVPDEDVALFAETFFGILEDANFSSYDELLTNPSAAISAISKTFRSTEPQKRKKMIRVLLTALFGKHRKDTGSGDVDPEYNVDWNHVETLMNDFEIKEFDKDYGLFL